MIQQKIRAIRNDIGHVKLIVVSKFRSIDELEEVYSCGERMFAENRVQELLRKKELLPADIEWHLIGHLQTNKVKQVIPFVKLIHSIDSIKLLDSIEKEAKKLDKKIQVLLQVHIAEEETKSGFDPQELLSLVQDGAFDNYEQIIFCGLMTMSTLNASEVQVSNEFAKADNLFHQLQPFMPNPEAFKEKSYGMSGDYKIACKHNSTMVRVGSLIFS